MKKIFIIFGTRPEAIKMAPVYHRLKKEKCFDVKLILSGQHEKMLYQAIDVFDMKVDYDLKIMTEGQTLTHITTSVLMKLKTLFKKEIPDFILVHGDTTTTLSATLSAFYHKIPVGHVEAGLRTFDLKQPFPEEANRIITDKLSYLHFAPTKKSKENLIKEGINRNNIFITGNTVIDALKMAINKAKKVRFKNNKLNTLKDKKIILLTFHRRENWGKPMKDVFNSLKKLIGEFKDYYIVYPVHLNPIIKNLAQEILSEQKRIIITKPLDYLEFLKIMNMSFFIVTDSGGIQEEAPSLNKPVLVLRNKTERPEALKSGAVRVIGTNEKIVYNNIKRIIENKKIYKKMAKAKNPFGDGRASERIVKILKNYFGRKEKIKEFL